jgi:hypothetical protein
MKTLLFNNNTSKVISKIFDDGYTVDGKPQAVKPPIYELEYKPTTRPVYDSILQVASAVWIPDIVLKTYTQVWEVRDKTEAELITEKEAQASAKENELDPAQIKLALRYTTDLLTEEEQVSLYSLYPVWKPNISVVVGEKYQHLGLLYKVIQSHNTQLDWKPQNVPALFVRVAAPEEIPNWVQPTGAHDAYQAGDKVRFNGNVYESLINANVWAPLSIGAENLWKIV